jgi:hypothetical protein
MENQPDIVGKKEKSKNNNKINIEEIDTKNKNIKYTFSGVAPNLIDKFLVLGYDPKILEYTFLNCENELIHRELKTRFKYYEFEERPYIVNEICNDYTKDLLDNDLVLELIFPNLPEMFFLDKQYINTRRWPDEELLITNYSIIFSINPQDNSGSKKSYNGLGFIFFAPHEHKTNDKLDGVFYVPTTYVILSEYPYFYHFNEICKNIYIQMKKESDEIPIDILIYNIVKYLHSPINKSINLTFAAPMAVPLNGKYNDLNKVLYPLVDSKAKDDNRMPSMFFNQMSGYPFMDLNFSFIFNLIPPEIIVEVFIFSFLENDIIFYSSRPEILNMVMFIFSNINYPFNDSIYYWHVLSVSQDSFMNGTSTFVGKTCSTITGILSQYKPEVLTTKKIKEHFVLDIDEKNFFFLYQEETEEVKDIMTLYQYIKSCATEFDEFSGEGVKIEKEAKIKNYFNDGIQLYECIKNLMEELQRRAKKVTATNYNEKIIKPSFLNLYENESEYECLKANMRLQKAFFSFITQIIQNFVRILSIGDEDKEFNTLSDNRLPSIVINIRKDELNEEEEKKRKLASKAGRIFKSKFQDCSKYSSFVINFCKYHDTIDLYKIPYTFINEFIYYSHIAVKNNLSEVDVFKLIDQFYGKKKVVSLDEIIKKKEKAERKEKKEKHEKKYDKEKESNNNMIEEIEVENVYVFNFINFINYYKKNLSAYINREQEDDKDIFVKVKSNSKFGKKYKRNGFYLSNKILSTYIAYVNNNSKEIRKLFKLTRCERYIENPSNRINSISEKSSLENFDEKNISSSAPFLSSKSATLKINALLNNNDVNQIFVNEFDDDILYDKTMNKTEKDLKIFGSYEFMEITDVIERHLILERCFSSYGLIKFSLLNVLAITRGLDGQNIRNPEVIKIMCDFCEKTKSLVRKYMNIFLAIFQALKVKDILPDKKQGDDCLSIIASHFKRTNMIPTEETTKTLNEIRNSTSTPEDFSTETTDVEYKNYIKSFIDTKGKFFEIHKESFLGGKNTRKKFDEVMKTIEAIFTGNYFASKVSINAISFDYKELDKLYIDAGIKDKEQKIKDKFLPKTPLSLYSSTNRLLREYLNNNFSNEKNIYNELLVDILSLLYYFKIPVIGEKWIDHYKVEEVRSSIIKSPRKDKNPKKIKEVSKISLERPDIGEINDIIKEIIAILIDLFEVIKNNKKKNIPI